MRDILSFSMIFKLAADCGSKDPQAVADRVTKMIPQPTADDVYKACVQELSARQSALEEKLACILQEKNSSN